MRDVDESMYWSPHEILTYNAIFNVVIGGRGTGKTFGSLEHCTKRKIKRNRGYIYLRRYETDLAKKDRLLTGIAPKFPRNEFRVEGQKLLTRDVKNEGGKWDVMGYCMALSTATSDKSIPFDDIDYVIFDEFLIARGMQRYMRGEVESFIDFYNTVDRMNDRVRVFFLANSIALANPYFSYFGINARKGQPIRLYKDGYIALQILGSKKFQTKATATRFGQMIQGTPYYDYAIGNEFRDTGNDFIAPKPDGARPLFAVTFDGSTLTVYAHYASGIYHVSSKQCKGVETYALTRSDFTVNTLMLDNSKRLLSGVSKMLSAGNVTFDKTTTRELWFDIEGYFNLR